MLRNLTLISLLTLTAAGASAQSRQAVPSNPFHPTPATTSAADFQQKLRRIPRAAHGSSGAMQKTTSGGECLIAEANYYLGNKEDSTVLKFSGNRTSVFDYIWLEYGFEGLDESDAPDANGAYDGSCNVHFDTARRYTPTGTSFYKFRAYNANDQIVRSDYESAGSKKIDLFTYNAQGRLESMLTVGYNSGSGTFTDTIDRRFYTYNAAGHLLMDSNEYWSSMTSSWIPNEAIKYTPNTSGNPVQAVKIRYYLGATQIEYHHDFVYDAANNLTLMISKSMNGNGNLENYYKDSMGFAGNMCVSYSSYHWNQTASAWDLHFENKRHLNAASLPDSIFARGISWDGSDVDTIIGKLAYTAHGNPSYAQGFKWGSTTPYSETRWYYESENGVGVKGITAKNDLSVYPNPASDMLYLKGEAEGRYSIHNMAGQVLQSGTLNAAAGLPVGTLAAGVYSLSLQDRNGVVRTTQFVRQ